MQSITKKYISIILSILLLITITACTKETIEESKQTAIFNPLEIPQYNGSPYCEINGNMPFFTDDELTTETFEEYSNLDALGRCGVAYANICPDTMPTEERTEMGMIKPSGWHTVKYNEIIDGNYLYNRCHLIAFCLAGENANDKNLITGTRYLNVEGMLPFEERVANYVESTGNHVLYRVTPIFEENNLVASGVLMEAKSVEDGGNGICFCSYCYNVQPGITIDYATGDSQVDEIVTTTKNGDYVEANEQSSEEADPQSITYIANKNTKVFHYPDCPGVGQMKEKNKIYSEKTRDELIGEGYKPCGNCHP